MNAGQVQLPEKPTERSHFQPPPLATGAPRPVPDRRGRRNTAGPRGSYRRCPPPARPRYLAQGLQEVPVPEGSAVPAPAAGP